MKTKPLLAVACRYPSFGEYFREICGEENRKLQRPHKIPTFSTTPGLQVTREALLVVQKGKVRWLFGSYEHTL